MSKSSEDLASAIRELSLIMSNRAKSSHIGSALSIADILAVLYHDVLTIDPGNPSSPTRDRFILSKGHACMALYSTLAIKGFIDIKELDTYGQSGSRLMAHISHKVPGVEFSTGSLGHGLPFAAGKALAAKKTGLEWRTFVLLGDGELDEGSNWEALLFSAHHKLSNLTVIVDANNLQSLTSVEETIGLEPMADKFRAFNCEVSELNGHSHEELKSALSQNPSGTQKPHVVIARTVKGKGVSFMENTVEWHYRNPNDSQLSDALLEVRSAN